MTQYNLRYQDAFGRDLTPLPFSTLQVAIKDMQVGAAVVTLDSRLSRLVSPSLFVLPDGDVQRDRRLLIERTAIGGGQELLGERAWLLRRVVTELGPSGAETTSLHFADGIHLLNRFIVAYNAGSAQANKTAAADTMIRDIVQENLGSSAGSRALDSAYFTAPAALGTGPTISKSFSRRNVLLVCQEIADAATEAGTYVSFDVLLIGKRLTLQTYVTRRGVDRRIGSNNALPVGPAYGNVATFVRNIDHGEEATVVYAAGQGEGADREVQTASRPDLINGLPFGRIEALRDARQIDFGNTAALLDEAETRLRQLRPRIQYDARMADTSAARYGRDYRFGDLLTVEYRDQTVDMRVDGVSIRVAGADEQIDAQLRQL